MEIELHLAFDIDFWWSLSLSFPFELYVKVILNDMKR